MFYGVSYPNKKFTIYTKLSLLHQHQVYVSEKKENKEEEQIPKIVAPCSACNTQAQQTYFTP